jgi:hypothetical protein
MASVSITNLPPVVTVVPPADVLPLVSGGVTTKATPNDVVNAVLSSPGKIGNITPSEGYFSVLSLLGANGIQKAVSGVFQAALPSVDYIGPTIGKQIQKADGTGGLIDAVSGADFAPPTKGTSILSGDNLGGFQNVTIGSGLDFTGGTLSSTTAGGTVTKVSVDTANGFAGIVLNAGTTPEISISTTVVGMAKGDGTNLLAATAGIDYVDPSVLAQPNGIATLDSTGVLTATQIPPISIVQYLGVVASQAAMLALVGQQGDWCTRSDLGTNWIITGPNPTLLSSWTQLSYPNAPVTSVNTQTGAVVLSYSNVGAAPATTGTSVLKANGSGGFSNAVSGTDYAPATTGTSILKGSGTGGFSNAVGGTDYQTAQSVTGIVKSSGTTRTAAVAGTDYIAPPSGTSILKANSGGALANAISGTDYAPATSGTSILYGNGSGGFSNVTVGSGLSFSGGTLASTSGGGSVTTVSVVSANGFAGTVANPSSTPAITLTTSVTGLLKGNGTAISAATSGTDYSAGTSALATGILKSTTSTGALSIAVSGTDYAPATSGTSILYGNGSGGFSNVTIGTNLTFSGGTLNATGGGGMVYPGAGIAVSTGSAWTTSKASPTGVIVGTTDTQTLTNKTLLASGPNTVEATSGPSSTQLAGNRNKIINGAMMIDQRNAGASVTPTTDGTYTLDRWRASLTQASKFSVQQNAGSVTPPVGFNNYIGITSTSAYSVVSTDIFAIQQNVEGLNVSDLSWGTVNAQTITISFWVYSSLTGTFGGALNNGSYNRSYPFTYTISSANTWQKQTITIPGDTSGTWLKTNGIGIVVGFDLGAGSTYKGTAGAWAGAYYSSATSAVSVVGTSGATFYITGVQLEKGATVTPFENRIYSDELAMCQRYYAKFGAGLTNGMIGTGQAGTTNTAQIIVFLPVQMRATPTVSSANLAVTDHQVNVSVSSVVVMSTQTNYQVAAVEASTANVLTQYRPYQLRNNNNASGYLDYSSEL